MKWDGDTQSARHGTLGQCQLLLAVLACLTVNSAFESAEGDLRPGTCIVFHFLLFSPGPFSLLANPCDPQVMGTACRTWPHTTGRQFSLRGKKPHPQQVPSFPVLRNWSGSALTWTQRMVRCRYSDQLCPHSTYFLSAPMVPWPLRRLLLTSAWPETGRNARW